MSLPTNQNVSKNGTSNSNETLKGGKEDLIAKLQTQLQLLGTTYTTAIQRCEQGLLEQKELILNINGTLKSTLELIDQLPNEDDNQDDNEFLSLQKEDEQVTEELIKAKLYAEKTVEKIQQLRRNLFQQAIAKNGQADMTSGSVMEQLPL